MNNLNYGGIAGFIICVALVISGVYSCKPCNPDGFIGRVDLEQISTGMSGVEGSMGGAFFLGIGGVSGSIASHKPYYFMYIHDDGIRPYRIDYEYFDRVRIHYIPKDQKPYVEFQMKKGYSRFCLGKPRLYHRIRICVHKDSITKFYNLDFKKN